VLCSAASGNLLSDRVLNGRARFLHTLKRAALWRHRAAHLDVLTSTTQYTGTLTPPTSNPTQRVVTI